MYTIKTEKVPGIKPKRFREKGRLHWRVRIFIDATPEELEMIRQVVYELHPTFKNRLRISDRSSRQFEENIWTYGYFKVKAKVILKDSRLEEISGFVKWDN